ncbi:hypothetical protein HUA78_36730 [Myxococcus sp. CA033]|nr:hypothetical protein [Myxococcus sp. CA033]
MEEKKSGSGLKSVGRGQALGSTSAAFGELNVIESSQPFRSKLDGQHMNHPIKNCY